MASLELILILFAVVAALELLGDKLEVPHASILVLAGAAERKELLNLRDKNVISDAVMRRIQKDLDLEQILLESTEAGPAELEDEDSAQAKA
jgi:hypothetical protein